MKKVFLILAFLLRILVCFAQDSAFWDKVDNRPTSYELRGLENKKVSVSWTKSRNTYCIKITVNDSVQYFAIEDVSKFKGDSYYLIKNKTYSEYYAKVMNPSTRKEKVVFDISDDSTTYYYSASNKHSFLEDGSGNRILQESWENYSHIAIHTLTSKDDYDRFVLASFLLFFHLLERKRIQDDDDYILFNIILNNG